MARPAKSVKTISKNLTNNEKLKREIAEELMQGDCSQLIPPDYLTESQIKIFNFIVNNLEESKILGSIDLYVLSQGAITIDRLINIEEYINCHSDAMFDTKLMATQDRLFKQFARICNELLLSPQSRAKISISVAEKTENKKTIMDLLNEDEDEE